MALSRNNTQRNSSNIWPGFVDAMTALLLILTFVLSIFMIVQFVLRETITGQDQELDSLSQQVAGLSDALGLEKTRASELEDDLGTTRSSLALANDELSTVREQVVSFEEQVAALIAQSAALRDEKATLIGQRDVLIGERDTLEGERDDLESETKRLLATKEELEKAKATEISEKEAAQLALAQARSEIDTQTEQARLAAAKREFLEKSLAEMQIANENLDSEIAALQVDQAEKAKALSEEEANRLAEAAAAQALRERLANSQDELTAMSLRLEEQRKNAEETLTLLAASKAAEELLRDQSTENLDQAVAQKALLAQANSLLSQEKAASAESQKKLALLNAQTLELRKQLNNLQGLLDASNERDADAQVQIQALGTNLNAALAQVAAQQRKLANEQSARADEQQKIAELEQQERIRLEEEAKDLQKFKSEFFGRLRDVLGAQEGVRIVGDRFVFSSEVLFDKGSADLGAGGQAEIRKVAGILNSIADEIPSEIDWILRVDGHTDRVPLSGLGEFKDNWELSQARALSVVRYLNQRLGIPADRLAANGFGEFQPLDPGNSEQAFATNRRIELKFTEK